MVQNVMSDAEKKYYTNYNYGNRIPMGIDIDELTDREQFLLMKSDVFCMLPWIHLHAFPNGIAYPCCLANAEYPVGSLKDNTMEEIWRSDGMDKIRSNMIGETKCDACSKCYEQEQNGFFSMRNSSNQAFGHYIKTIHDDAFHIRYYDVRFSNLCNLSCRTCGDIFSSNWVKEHKRYGWADSSVPTVTYAGKHQYDAYEQLLPHIPYLHEIYFAGGEPLIMEEHYLILKELLTQGRNDVKIVYNTNFTELEYKSESVLPLWNEFECVSVGASLDASYQRGELMRKGTDWNKVVRNREEMLKVCPDVDFYVSSTLSVMNSYHLPDFHKEWVQQGLINAMDWNINILQGPDVYRIDILPDYMKAEVNQRYKDHIEWLEPLDEFKRAINGFKSAINVMMSESNTHNIKEFLRRTIELDGLRNESFFETFPELKDLERFTNTG